MLYIRKDLAHLNEVYVAPDMEGVSLQAKLLLTTAIIQQAAISSLMVCEKRTNNLLSWKSHSRFLAIKTRACSKRYRQKGKEQRHEHSVAVWDVVRGEKGLPCYSPL